MEQDMAGSSPLMDSGDETSGLRVIRSGMALRSEGDGSFWEDFLSLCNDADGLADLLGVKREIVASWASRVREALENVRRHDAQSEEKPDEKEKLLPTGDNGAVTVNNMGPFGPAGGR
jgi:hypothetical protein